MYIHKNYDCEKHGSALKNHRLLIASNIALSVPETLL